jgi:hypothetical protein
MTFNGRTSQVSAALTGACCNQNEWKDEVHFQVGLRIEAAARDIGTRGAVFLADQLRDAQDEVGAK